MVFSISLSFVLASSKEKARGLQIFLLISEFCFKPGVLYVNIERKIKEVLIFKMSK